LDDFGDIAAPLETNNESTASLETSLQLVSQRGHCLLARVCELVNDKDTGSPVVKACRLSLESDFLSMLEEAQLLLNNMNDSEDYLITSWRVSLAQIRVDAYLESIETALDCPDVARLNVELAKVSNRIASQLEMEHAQVRISPWNLPSLAFDITVGAPVQHVLDGSLPLNLQVYAIQEVPAVDMITKNKRVSYRACKLTVERCVHEVGTFRAGAGSVGDVLLTVKVSPMEEAKDDSIETTQNWENDVLEERRPVVKEARTVQVNAFPPSPKSSVDLYVSSNHDDSDATITLRFPTFKTLNGEVPDIRVELVMG
jgi:hypothetical protein